jgi:hypothetical protein
MITKTATGCRYNIRKIPLGFTLVKKHLNILSVLSRVYYSSGNVNRSGQPKAVGENSYAEGYLEVTAAMRQKKKRYSTYLTVHHLLLAYS